VNDILTELEIGLHVHSWHASEDSPPNSESDSDDRDGSDTTSESEDGSDNDSNNGINNGVTDKIEKFERDFRKLYNIFLVLGVERDNYILLQKAYTE